MKLREWILRDIRKFDALSKVIILTSVKDKKEFNETKKLGAKGI